MIGEVGIPSPGSIGRRIRAARKARGLTQHGLARQAGISQSQISRLEADRALSGLKAGCLVAIARALGIAPTRLAAGTKVEGLVGAMIREEGRIIAYVDRARIISFITNEIAGYGPLEVLLTDPSITEIMVNGPREVFIERGGQISRSHDVVFMDEEHIRHIIDRIVSPIGRRIDESSPMVDARLPDGSRINAIIPPLALNGPTLTIRRFHETPLTIEDLIGFGTLAEDMAEFLRACVVARLNILISGGTGSGKTTTLNVMGGFIPGTQ